MRFIKQASIQRKQQLIIMLTTGVALLLACAAFAAYEVITFRTAMVENLTTLARIIGNDTSAALDFSDAKTAQETLSSLEAESHIIGAAIYTRDGEVFAVYGRPASRSRFKPPQVRPKSHSFPNGSLALFEPVVFKGETIGMVYLESDLHALYSRLEQYAAIVTGVFFVAMFAAFLLSARLHRVISEPIMQLVNTARAVARDRNYALRAVKRGEDELGALTDGFNEMLCQIQARDAALKQSHLELERRVEERTQELANSLSLIHATLESTPDGILANDADGNPTHFNERFLSLWRIPPEVAQGKDESRFLGTISRQLRDPAVFLDRVRHLYSNPGLESFDVLELADGRIIERHSIPRRTGDKMAGRVWNFRDVTERKRSEAQLDAAHRQLVGISRQAGMAEVATSVLHNVGNVLNSVNVSGSVILDKVRKSRVPNFCKAAFLLESHKDDLTAFLSSDPKGRRLPGYFANLAPLLSAEQEEILRELALLISNIGHIKEIVAMQQSYARVSGARESLNVVDLVEDAIRMNAGALRNHHIKLVRDFQEKPAVTVDKHKVLQVLVNLIRNAKYALDEGEPPEKVMTLRIATNRNGSARISVMDNGAGIPAENLTRIFAHGFTTRHEGHGFGLHSGALAAKELGGSLTVHSDGPGRGASFTLEFPCQPESKTNPKETNHE